MLSGMNAPSSLAALVAGLVLGYVFFRTPAQVPAPNIEPPRAQVEAPAPPEPVHAASDTASTPPERVEIGCQQCAEKDAEIARLNAEIARLRSSIVPTTQGQIAAAAGVTEEELQTAMDRSDLFANAQQLTECARMVGAQATWDALKAEEAFRVSCFKFRAANHEPAYNPDDPNNWRERHEWHVNTYVPWLTVQIEQLTRRLYAMGLPSSIVEPFRSKLNEGI